MEFSVWVWFLGRRMEKDLCVVVFVVVREVMVVVVWGLWFCWVVFGGGFGWSEF